MNLASARRYWVTGSSNGLGAALAEELLKSGAHVAVSSRFREPLEQFAQRYPGQVLVMEGDLTNSQTVREFGEQIAQAWGALDTVILNAGTCEYVDAKQFDSSIVEYVVRTNLLASSYCIEAALPLLRAGRTPHLVGIASAVTYLPLPLSESRASLRHLFESLRADRSSNTMDITVVSPGFVDTPLTEGDNLPMPLNWSAHKAARHIFAKLQSRPSEIAFPALSLAVLWPLSTLLTTPQQSLDKHRLRNPPPHKDDL